MQLGLPPVSKSENIPLIKTPEIFFDEQEWKEFVACFPTREIALARISCPPYYTGFHTEQVSLAKFDHAGREKIDSAFRLGSTLGGELKRKIVAQELDATGVPLPWGDRVSIPPEQWKVLWPSFKDDCAMGPMFGFSQVQLRRNSSNKTLKVERQLRINAWMRTRAAAEESQRKTLEKEAKDRFGSDFRSREFSAAYKAIFMRSPGRPPKRE